MNGQQLNAAAELLFVLFTELVDLEIRPLEIKSLETAADTTDEEISTIIAGGQINRVEVETVASKPRSRKKKAAATKPVAAKAPAKRSKKVDSKKKTVSFVDCSNIIFCRERNIEYILSFDSHFDSWISRIS